LRECRKLELRFWEAYVSGGSSTLIKGLGLLRLMSQYPQGAPAAVFAKESGMPFSTAYRLLNTLTEAGYAEFDATTKQYRVGLTVFELSQRDASASGYNGSVNPVLKTPSAATNETSLSSARDGNETVNNHPVERPTIPAATYHGNSLPN